MQKQKYLLTVEEEEYIITFQEPMFKKEVSAVTHRFQIYVSSVSLKSGKKACVL